MESGACVQGWQAGRGWNGWAMPWLSFPGFRVDDWTAVPSLLPGLEPFKPPQALRRPRKLRTSLPSLPTTDFLLAGSTSNFELSFRPLVSPGFAVLSLTSITAATHDILFYFIFGYFVFILDTLIPRFHSQGHQSFFPRDFSIRSTTTPRPILAAGTRFTHHDNTSPFESLQIPSKLLADISLWQTISAAWLSHNPKPSPTRTTECPVGLSLGSLEPKATHLPRVFCPCGPSSSPWWEFGSSPCSPWRPLRARSPWTPWTLAV